MGGALPIPYSSIDRYAQRFGLDDVDEFDRFHALIQKMDATYLKWAAAKAKREKGKK